jgi:ABC-2 type transport system ATP-binding protein
MISGLSIPTAGSYSLFGKTGYAMKKMLRDVGVLIEYPGLYPRLSAYENLKIKCIGAGIRPAGYVEELLRIIGLENTDRKKPAGSYSLGMRQRLGIAQAIMERPSLIILDEPMNGLDRSGVEDMRAVFAKLRDEGKTILLASHAAEDIEILCDAVYELENGTVSGPKLPG